MAKKFMISVVSVLICVFLFTSCHPPGTVAATGFYDAYHIVSRNVPYADTTFVGQFDKVKKLEEDAYGRLYYSYETYSTSLQTQIEIHVICQKAEEQRAYYYEDYCYMIRKEDDPPFSGNSVAQLKERNDWGKSLNQEKMREVPFDMPNISVGYEAKCKKAILNHLGLPEDYGCVVHGLEFEESEKQVMFINTFRRTDGRNNIEFDRFYLVVYGMIKNRLVVLACEEIEPIVDCQDMVSDFKARHLGS